MKRVIVLSWFKPLMNRLFGPDDDSREVDVYEDTENESIESIEQLDRKQAPSFRFPIVSDAEIYGWDDEPTKEREYPENTSYKEEVDDDYETKPLYENDRWPGDPRDSNIFRAGSTQKYGVELEDKRVVFRQSDKDLKVEQFTKVKKPVQKRSNRPFTPTAVPSPVFGYTTPKREMEKIRREEEVEVPPLIDSRIIMEEPIAEEVRVTLNTANLSEDEFVPAVIESLVIEKDSIEIVSNDVVHLKNALSEVESAVIEEDSIEIASNDVVHSKDAFSEVESPMIEEDSKEIALNDVLHSENEFSEVQSPMIEEDSIEISSNEVLHSTDVFREVESPMIEEDSIEIASNDVLHSKDVFREVESPMFEEDSKEIVFEDLNHSNDTFSEVEYSLIEKNFDGIVLDDIEHTKEAFMVREEDSLPDVIESEEEQQVLEHRKERIVPFNVLMLKSDKEKVAVKNYSNAHLMTEEVSKESNESISFQPLVKVTEELLEDVKVIESDISDNIEEEPYYAFPSLDYLVPPEAQFEDKEWMVSQSEKLEEALSHFAVQATVIDAAQGPTVTRFELTVGQGTKVSKIRNLTDDLKLALAAVDIRIQAPIPGRSSIGIEIPNRKTRAVRISEVIATDSFQASTSPLEAVLGLSLTGTPVTLDLRKMPHGMIAGATGSGKSVCINSILVSLLYKASPMDLKMMLIDPKMVELAPFNGIPHLISPVITDVKAATAALKWAVAEMERRYELLAHAGVRDIERYNKVVVESRRFSLKMPYLLIVIDELADLMMMAPADVEVSISRIAQKARACGIHLIIATQRPSVDVITGTIKANIPTRIAFSVSSQIDSRTIIDSPGAERLLGKGDMLYIGNGQSSGVRLQGTFVTDDEIERIIEHVRNEAAPDYLFGQDDLLASAVEEEETDPLFDEACIFILEQGSASTSLLQRNFSIGYNRAAKLIDRMEKNGFISGQRGSKARDVFLTESDLDRFTDRSD